MKSRLSSVPMNAFFDLTVDSRTRGHSWKIVKKRCLDLDNSRQEPEAITAKSGCALQKSGEPTREGR